MATDYRPREEHLPEPYLRVTNSLRFAPLHDAAEALLRALESMFRVTRTEGYGLDLELERKRKLVRPTIKLLPDNPEAAPLVVAFSSFPGLLVRAGRWYITALPACGCDACGESVEGEEKRLLSIVGHIVTGQFEEAIHTPPVEDVWIEFNFGAQISPAADTHGIIQEQIWKRLVECLPELGQRERVIDAPGLSHHFGERTYSCDRGLAAQLIEERGGPSSYRWVQWPKLASST